MALQFCEGYLGTLVWYFELSANILLYHAHNDNANI